MDENYACEKAVGCYEPTKAIAAAGETSPEGKTSFCKSQMKSTQGESKIPSLTICRSETKASCELPRANDLERRLNSFEHVVSVQGMTCTGCETKLSQSIRALPGIYNIRTSLVLAEAEFDIDLSTFNDSIKNAIKFLQRVTSFTCMQVIR